jgi:hypothetical protein
MNYKKTMAIPDFASEVFAALVKGTLRCNYLN